MNPMPDDAANAARRRAAVGHAHRRREAAVRADGRGVRRLLASTPTPRSAGSSTTSRRPASSTTRSIFYCADNGASGEGSPNGSVNENKFFNGYPDELTENLKLPRRPRQPGHLQPLPDRLGDGVLDAVPDVQALLATRAASATRWSSTGRRASRPRARSATSTTTRSTSSRRSSSASASRCPKTYRGVRAGPAARRLDALHASTTPTRPTAEEAPVLRDARHPRHLGGGLEGRRRARADQPGTGHFDEDEWQLYHTDEDRSEAHDLADAAPGEAQGADRRLVRGGREVRRAAARRPASLERSCVRAAAGRADARDGGIVYYPDTAAGARSRSRPTSAAARSRSSPRSSIDDADAAGRDLRPRLALRRPRALRQGPEAAGTSTTSSASRPSSSSSRPTSSSPASTCSGWSSSRRAHGRARRGARHRRRSTSTTRSWPRAAWKTQSGPLHALRRGAHHRPRQRRPGHRRSTPRPFAFTGGPIRPGRGRRRRRPVRRPRARLRRPRWLATEPR